MRKFGLVGYPLGHSFSRRYFTRKFQTEDIKDCAYENYPLEEISMITELVNDDPYLCGLNITIPYKREVIPYLDSTEPEAGEIGAVNVVKIKRSGDEIQLSGFNSDVTGIRESLMPYLKRDSGNALILGTGGASLAVNHVLKGLGMNVILVSRKKRSGVITYDDLDRHTIHNADLIVNTTPLGMFPDVEGKPPLDYNLLRSDQILFDLVYNPERTTFLKEGEKRGAIVISGIKMLYSQAEKSWEIWNDDTL